MTKRGDATKSALLVIDVQNGVVANAYNRDGVVQNISKMVDHARSCDVPVIWIQHEAEDLVRDSDEWQIVSELEPKDEEKHLYKKYSDSFADTDLSGMLEELGVGHLVVSGAATNACVRATTYRAAGEGFDVTLVQDGHTTEDLEWEDYNLKAKSMIDDLNLTLQFIDWPEQKVTSAPTADILKM